MWHRCISFGGKLIIIILTLYLIYISVTSLCIYLLLFNCDSFLGRPRSTQKRVYVFAFGRRLYPTQKATWATAADSCRSFSMYTGDDERLMRPVRAMKVERVNLMQMSSGGDSQLWADLDTEGGKRQKERKTMEELIIAVSGFPELYDLMATGPVFPSQMRRCNTKKAAQSAIHGETGNRCTAGWLYMPAVWKTRLFGRLSRFWCERPQAILLLLVRVPNYAHILGRQVRYGGLA